MTENIVLAVGFALLAAALACLAVIDDSVPTTAPGSPSVWVSEEYRDSYRTYWQKQCPPLGY